MSGGSYNYEYSTVDYTYVGHMHDAELNELMRDLVGVLHDLEWWQSGDIGEDSYRKTVKDFKDRWIGRADALRADFYARKLQEAAKQYAIELFGLDVH